ncbi:MAG: 3-oxoacyl-ACP reductase [Flavobacteriaceae bacterium]|nr:MAG: 3-oxoacyl-ACP reductase [Flavobacteriaceae bacterium]
MDLGLKEKIVLVAAASQGLGKATALEFAKEGAHVAICGRNLENLAAAKNEITQVGTGTVFTVQGDLSIEKDRENILESILNNYGHIDILVCNTGGPPSGNFDSFSMEDWNTTYQSLLASTVSLIKGVLPGMKNQGWGRIISITSISAKQPIENLLLSNSMRAAVVGLMKTLANDLGKYNITVNNIMPGYTKTNRLLSLIEKNPSMNNLTKEIPLQRFGSPEEFAATVVFMASTRASYITGTSLAVDGGWIKNIL